MTFAWRPGSQYHVAATRGADSVPDLHRNRASPFASDFYRRRGYRRELRGEDHFYPFSSQKKSRFASDFHRRGNRASWGLKKSRDFSGSGKNRHRNRSESRDFGALSSVLASDCRAQFGRPSTRRGCRICVTVRLPVRRRGETMYWQANANTPLSVTPFLNVPYFKTRPSIPNGHLRHSTCRSTGNSSSCCRRNLPCEHANE